MKLKDLAKHIPVHQYVRVCQNMRVQDMGFLGKTDALQRHLNKTVGTFYVKDGVLEINVLDKQ